MKIAIISTNRTYLNEIGLQVQAALHEALLIEGGNDRMRAAAEQDEPDLMLVDGTGGEVDTLAQIEYVTTHHPRILYRRDASTTTPSSPATRKHHPSPHSLQYILPSSLLALDSFPRPRPSPSRSRTAV